MTIRTFVALEIPKEALLKIIALRNETVGGSPNFRWEPIEKLHLTLKFLGNTKEELIETYSEGIEEIVADYKNIEMSFNKFGVFRKEDVPKILWVGLNDNEDLSKMVNDIESFFAQSGYESGRREFSPHITLLRFRGHEDSQNILSLTCVIIPEIKFIANKVTFFQSKLTPSSSVYKSLKSFYLKN